MGKRPPHIKPPAHWTKGPPAPQPDPVDKPVNAPPPGQRDETRYGDWEKNGIAIDF